MGFSPTQRFRPLRRIEYDQLIGLGAFHDEKIELLEGVLVPMSPSGPPHSSAVQKLNAILTPALSGRAAVRIQSPFAALDLSEPEPDVAVVPSGSYERSHPDRAYLIIEVAETSLSVDRGVKQRLYATCGVPEYWIVDLIDRTIEVYTQPVDGAYTETARHAEGGILRPAHFADVEIHVSRLLS